MPPTPAGATYGGPVHSCDPVGPASPSRRALLAAALAQGRLDLLRHAMQDYVHQVWRAPLVPGLSDILEHAHEYGALGAALSGAGPTVLALVDAVHEAELVAVAAPGFQTHVVRPGGGATLIDTREPG